MDWRGVLVSEEGGGTGKTDFEFGNDGGSATAVDECYVTKTGE